MPEFIGRVIFSPENVLPVECLKMPGLWIVVTLHLV